MEAIVADLVKKLSKKASFESAATALASLFRDRYASANDSERKAMFAAASRAGGMLQSRYTGKAFWLSGLQLFEAARDAVSDPQEQATMKQWVNKAREFLGEETLQETLQSSQAGPSSSFLFEGQLTAGPEPAPPAWLVAQNAFAAMEVADRGSETFESMLSALQNLVSITPGLEEAIQASLQNPNGRPPPPASKEEVEKLAVIDVTQEILTTLNGTECAVCREVLVLNDKMQEMPCKHYFHPPCLKPWLDEHNSCPICRYELRTDDHEYESRKERDREAEAEREGAANAVRDNALMYI